MTPKSEILNSKLIFKANTKLVDRAKTMSRAMTKAEQILWFNVLKSRKLAEFKFVKQKQLFNYILDFYCSELLLVIEVDGSSHDNQIEYDKQWDDFLRSCGLEIVRVGNSDVENNLEGTYLMLLEMVKLRNSKFPLAKGVAGEAWRGLF
jgi:very-short-patch-repair endonuclease